MEHPDLNLLIQQTKHTENDEKQHQLPPNHDQTGLLSTIRARTGNALIDLGTRITPTCHPRRHPYTASRPATITGS